MGRTLPEIQHSQSLRDELALTQAVDEAVARVAPLELPDASDGEADALVDQVMAELDGAAAGAAAAAPTPRPMRKPPLVFLDAVEVTQEVQDLTHSVPLVARKPTIVRAYLRCGPPAARPVPIGQLARRSALAPVSLRGMRKLRLKPRSARRERRPASELPDRDGSSCAEPSEAIVCHGPWAVRAWRSRSWWSGRARRWGRRGAATTRSGRRRSPAARGSRAGSPSCTGAARAARAATPAPGRWRC